MAITIETLHTTYYLDEVMFCWSPCVINVWRDEYVSQVRITVFDVDVNKSIHYYLEFATDVYKLDVDISRALQPMGNNVKIVMFDNLQNGVADIFNVQGAKGMLENFGGEYTVRYWEDYPIDFGLLYERETILYYARRGQPVKLQDLSTDTSSGIAFAKFGISDYGSGRYYATGKVFKEGTWQEGLWSYSIVNSCVPKDSIYLRWVDNSGLRWYWMFRKVKQSIVTSQGIEYSRLHSYEGDYINEWNTEVNKEVGRTLTIIAEQITREEAKVVSTLIASSRIDAYDKDAGVWYRVRAVNGDYTLPGENYSDYEFTIELPTYQTQLL